MSRRGQSASKSAVAVLLIGLILVLYILFLPPTEREALLSGAPSTGGTGGYGGNTYSGPPVAGGGILLMEKFVGTLQPESAGNIQHSLPSTTVFTAINTQEIKFIDSLQLRGGAFSNKEHSITFLTDQNIGNNYLLSFNVEEAKGTLMIYLNNQLIFDRKMTQRSPEPVRLPKELLRPQNNLTFRTDGTGWAFWDANGYLLRNIIITGDVADFQGSTAEQTFTITPDEYQRMDKAILEFVPQCNPSQAGRLSVGVNSQLVYSGFIDCGVLTRQDIPKEQLSVGSNRVGFSSSQGSYTIDRIKVISQLAKEDYATYYFNLPPDMWQQANVFAGRVILTMRFSEGNTIKRGSVIVNGFQDSFQTQDYYFQANLDPNILIPNANSIQIIPDGDSLNIPQLSVELLG